MRESSDVTSPRLLRSSKVGAFTPVDGIAAALAGGIAIDPIGLLSFSTIFCIMTAVDAAAVEINAFLPIPVDDDMVMEKAWLVGKVEHAITAAMQQTILVFEIICLF